MEHTLQINEISRALTRLERYITHIEIYVSHTYKQYVYDGYEKIHYQNLIS